MPQLKTPKVNKAAEVRAIMLRGEWVMPLEIKRELEQRNPPVCMCDSAITARIREMRRPQFGSYTITTRPISPGSTQLEYHAEKK